MPLLNAYEGALAGGNAFPRRPPVTLEVFRSDWLADKTAILVAQHGRAVVGSYWLRPNFPGEAAHIANPGYLVVREFRRQGVGRALLSHSLDEARTRGFDALLFNLVFENNPARRLYERCGFRVVGRIPAAVEGRDALIYWRAL